jgi:hypothetical protein
VFVSDELSLEHTLADHHRTLWLGTMKAAVSGAFALCVK